jgi:hypothetical protein
MMLTFLSFFSRAALYRFRDSTLRGVALMNKKGYQLFHTALLQTVTFEPHTFKGVYVFMMREPEAGSYIKHLRIDNSCEPDAGFEVAPIPGIRVIGAKTRAIETPFLYPLFCKLTPLSFGTRLAFLHPSYCFRDLELNISPPILVDHSPKLT